MERGLGPSTVSVHAAMSSEVSQQLCELPVGTLVTHFMIECLHGVGDDHALTLTRRGRRPWCGKPCISFELVSADKRDEDVG